jgi:hypothetical protein
VSFDKIRNQIGFRCAWTIEDGIREIYDALANKEIIDYTDPWYHNQKYLKTAGCLPNKSELDVRIMAAFASGAGQPAAAAFAELAS